MNTHTFERKNFLDGAWMKENYFSTDRYSGNIVIKVNLLRATANESEYLKKYLSKISFMQNKNIIFDLSTTKFIDSTFLSNIITFNNKNHLNVKLIISDKKQLAIFKITKIDSIFNIYSSLDQALVS